MADALTQQWLDIQQRVTRFGDALRAEGLEVESPQAGTLIVRTSTVVPLHEDVIADAVGLDDLTQDLLAVQARDARAKPRYRHVWEAGYWAAWEDLKAGRLGPARSRPCGTCGHPDEGHDFTEPRDCHGSPTCDCETGYR